MSLRQRLRALEGYARQHDPAEYRHALADWKHHRIVPTDSVLRPWFWRAGRFLIAVSSMHQAGTLTDQEVEAELSAFERAYEATGGCPAS